MTTSMFEVTAPVDDHTGPVAGVDFVKGRAEVPADNAAALAYFRRHGYGVVPVDEAGKAKRAPAKKAAAAKKAADPKQPEDQGDGQAAGDGGTPPSDPKE